MKLGDFMSPTIENFKIKSHEKEFEVEIYEENGKVFAKTHVNNFGEIRVPDFGGGKEKAILNIQARIGNIMTALATDKAREDRLKQRELEKEAKKQQAQVQNIQNN